MAADGLMEWIQHGGAYLRLRTFNPRHPDDAEEMLIRNRIWLSDVTAQDDIYEGQPLFAWPHEPDADKILALTKKRIGDDAQAIEIAKSFVERLRNPVERTAMQGRLSEAFANLYRSSSIASFFRDPLSQPHWAGYAGGGSGFGALFDFSRPWNVESAPGMGPMETVPFEVEYVSRDARPTINLDFAPADPLLAFDDIKKGLLTKSNEWSHQREERLVRIGIPASYIDFPPDSLRAIVLGYAINDRDRQNLLGLAGQRPATLPVLEARRSDSGYGLTLHRVA